MAEQFRLKREPEELRSDLESRIACLDAFSGADDIHRVLDEVASAIALANGAIAAVRDLEARGCPVSAATRCPNCLREHGPLEACFLGVIAGVLVDRGTREVTPEQLARVHVDEMWDRYGGPAVDWLEDHLRWLEVNGEV